MGPRSRVAVWVIGLVAIAGAPSPSEAGIPPKRSHTRLRMPGPQHGRPAADRIVANAGCVQCHPVQAEQWRSSGHRLAFTRATFQRALAQEPRAFCRGCHAPEADPRRPTPDEAAAIGVACVSCHVVDGEILAGPGDASPREHAVRRDAAFASVGACASCHEFELGSARQRGRSTLMQSTVSEHARSPASAIACAQCHMLQRDGVRDHAFAASRDPDVVRSAVRVTARRDACRIEIELAPAVLGHAFPTGDLFRRLEVRASSSVWEDRRHLARHFGVARSAAGPTIVELADDRVGPDGQPRIVAFDVPAAACDEPIAWAVEYQRVQEMPIGDARAAVVEGRIVLDEGTL